MLTYIKHLILKAMYVRDMSLKCSDEEKQVMRLLKKWNSIVKAAVTSKGIYCHWKSKDNCKWKQDDKERNELNLI